MNSDKNNGNGLWGSLRSLLWIVLIALFIRGSVVEAFIIPSLSMLPTLTKGDNILVWKLSYGVRLIGIRKSLIQYAKPARGEIVVFTRPDDPSTPNEDESDKNIIKRVIGLPGDIVQVKGTKVTINDEVLTETYARWQEGGAVGSDFGPVKVPPGTIFLLGDNRDNSTDSRFWRPSPFLPIENVKGRAFLIYFNRSDLGRIGNILR